MDGSVRLEYKASVFSQDCRRWYDTRFMRRRVCIQDWCVRLLFFWWRLDTREGGEVHIMVRLCEKVFWSLENLTRIDTYKPCSELGVRERGRR